jgi:hypothetical protein
MQILSAELQPSAKTEANQRDDSCILDPLLRVSWFGGRLPVDYYAR